MQTKIVIEETASGFGIEMRGSGMTILKGLMLAVAALYRQDRRDGSEPEEFAMDFAKTLMKMIKGEGKEYHSVVAKDEEIDMQMVADLLRRYKARKAGEQE